MIGSLPQFQQRLLRWYDAHRRDLPWRRIDPLSGHPDPYHVLVSELMLQQTQVATVIDYFNRFIERWPNVRMLAEADQQAVLRQWQGLGYYSRARHLHQAAQQIVRDFAGTIPRTVEALTGLPGVGRYTAGAVASIAFGRRAPILDGNVTRVLCRLDAIEDDPRTSAIQRHLWKRAEAILPDRRTGDFNSALMELGATVCHRRGPECRSCPVRMHCRAAADNRQASIPPIHHRPVTPLHRRWTYCIEHRGRWLIERRPERGRWGGLWQFITLDAAPTAGPLDLHITDLRPLGQVNHALTHRRYEFIVHRCRLNQKRPPPMDHRRWVRLAELDEYPMSRPQTTAKQWLTA